MRNGFCRCFFQLKFQRTYINLPVRVHSFLYEIVLLSRYMFYLCIHPCNSTNGTFNVQCFYSFDCMIMIENGEVMRFSVTGECWYEIMWSTTSTETLLVDKNITDGTSCPVAKLKVTTRKKLLIYVRQRNIKKKITSSKRVGRKHDTLVAFL